MMLGDGEHRQIVASTISEIRGALDLVKEGKLDEVCNNLILSLKGHRKTNNMLIITSASTASQSPPVPSPTSKI